MIKLVLSLRVIKNICEICWKNRIFYELENFLVMNINSKK